MTSSMDGAVAKYVISVNTLIKADFLESENLGQEPFVLGGNAGQREIWRHAIRLTCFLGTAHLRFQRRKLVDNCSSSELTWCYWPLPGCHGISSSLQISVDVTLKISREYRREYPSLRPTCSAVARTCCRAGGVLGTTVVDLDRGETGAACWGAAQIAVPVAPHLEILRHSAWKDFQDFHRYFQRNPYVGLQKVSRGTNFFGRRRKEMFNILQLERS